MSRRRASPEEREQRLAELGELIAARLPQAGLVRFASQTWGLGRRSAEKYVAEARARLSGRAAADPGCERDLALASYELLFRRQLKGGDLRGARATLDKIVALLGLARAAGERPLTLAQLAAEIARLEAELEGLEAQTP